MLPLEINELWDSYRRTTLAADATESEIEQAWNAFHGGIFALGRVLALMDDNGEGDGALAVVHWISEQLSEARKRAPGRQ